MSSGLFNVGSYQAAGHPYLTGSTIAPGQQQAYFLPAVSKRVKVQINDVSGGIGAIRVHFANSTVNNNVMGGNHYWTVFQTAELRNELDLEVKCKEIYITGQTGGAISYQVVAELTGIPATDMYPLSGSGIDK
jgi:hypothetical protein